MGLESRGADADRAAGLQQRRARGRANRGNPEGGARRGTGQSSLAKLSPTSPDEYHHQFHVQLAILDIRGLRVQTSHPTVTFVLPEHEVHSAQCLNHINVVLFEPMASTPILLVTATSSRSTKTGYLQKRDPPHDHKSLPKKLQELLAATKQHLAMLPPENAWAPAALPRR